MRGDSSDEETRIGCTDLVGRRHDLIVIEDVVGLVLVFPPQAWAVFDASQREQLQAALSRPTAGQR